MARITDHEALELIEGKGRQLSESDFRIYQRWMAQHCYDTPFVLLAAGMGLGKTGAALWVARKRLDEGAVRKVLVVAPVNVANETWPEELRVWDFARPLSWSLLTGPAEEREAARLEDTEIHIINRENVVWLFRQWGRKWPYDMLIYDEASRLKGAKPKTQPVERKDGSMSTPKLSEFGALSRTRMYFDYVIELSGTPAPNGLKDLWGPFYILDRGERLGTSKTAFMKRWFNEDRYTHKITPFAHSEREIMDRVEDIMVSLRKEDYLTLPPVVPVDHWVTLPPPIMKKYKQFEKDMLLREYDVEAVNSGVLVNKLLQFANGSIYDDDGKDRPVHDLKLQKLESIVEEAAGEPLLIAYSFKFDLERIKKRFPRFRVFGETKNDMRDWNDGKLDALIVHPASAGHGMNFQYGGHIFVWYGLNWSLELYQQFNERLPRSGQKAERVFMHRILARGTEDANQDRNLQMKGATQDSITERVRVRMEDMRRRLGA